jgi:hypothetical protein
MAATLLRAIGLTLMLVATSSCGTGDADYDQWSIEPRAMDVEPGAYVGVAWLEDDVIALGTGAPEAKILLVDPTGSAVGHITPDVRPECRPREFMGLSATPAGQLGFADVCLTSGHQTVALTTAGTGSDTASSVRGDDRALPLRTAWAADGTIVYSTGDLLCSTLYRRGRDNEPMRDEVEVDGRRFSAGQDLGLTPDGCPVGGRAGYPAYTRDGQVLAFLASSDGDTPPGPALADRPWTILVDRDGRFVPILHGVTGPRDLAWGADQRHLLVAGRLFDRAGVWCIDIDDRSVALVSAVEAADIAADPTGNSVVAVLDPDPSESTDHAAVITLDVEGRCGGA